MNQQKFNPEKFEKLFKEELESNKFDIPQESLSNLVPVWGKVLEVNSLEKLNCDFDIYSSILNELLKDKPTFNLYQASYLINGLTKSSARDLGLRTTEYSRVLFYSIELSKTWNEKVIPIREKLMDKLKRETALVMPGKNRLVNPNIRK